MNTRDIAAEYRLAHWAQIMQDRADKRISVRAYCESIGIHQNTYFYWQHKLREAAASEIQATATLPEEKSIAPKGWAALCISSGHDEESTGLTVEVGGCHIAICTDTDLELLSKVCQVLKTL
jgi:putative transposase